MFGTLRSFLFGLSLPWKSFQLITSHRKLMLWSALPVLVTIALYSFGFVSLQDTFQTWISGILTARGVDGFWLTLAVWVSRLLIFLVAALTFSFASTLIASPLNDFLAEAAEPLATPPLPPVTLAPGARVWIYKIRLLWIDVAKTLASSAASLLAILISWIPLLNVAGFVLLFLVMSFQYTSYPQTRRGLSLREGAQFLGRHFPACVGFGMATTFLFSVPFLSLLALPLSVVGGTLLVARFYLPTQIQGASLR